MSTSMEVNKETFEKMKQMFGIYDCDSVLLLEILMILTKGSK